MLVTADGAVENRLFTPPIGLTPSAMQAAANFLNAILQGRTLGEMRGTVAAEIARRRAELDALSAEPDRGRASRSGPRIPTAAATG